jgi:hypothetical protein
MKPSFAHGWVRWKTTLLPVKWQERFQILWQVQYDKTNSEEIIDFGPEVWTTFSGKVAFTNPTDLKKRIEKATKTVEPEPAGFRR